MKEYEVVQEITNACGGSNVPQTSITEMQLDDIEAYVKSKHPKDFDRAVKELEARGIEIIVHTILGLPGETADMMLDTVRYVNSTPAAGIKLQLLHILKHTDLADYYQHTGFHILTMNEYVDLVIRCLEVCRPDLVIHRLTGDGPKDLLIAPEWSQAKRQVLNTIQKELKRRNTFQGRLYSP